MRAPNSLPRKFQNRVRSSAAASPAISGQTSRPSQHGSSALVAPTRLAKVGIQSTTWIGRDTVAGRSVPGQLMTAGVRIPPS